MKTDALQRVFDDENREQGMSHDHTRAERRDKRSPHPKVILLVDENPDFLDAVTEVLDMYVVHTAGNTCEAVKLLEEHSYDVILLTLWGDGRLRLLKRALKLGLVAVVLGFRPVLPPTRKSLRELGPVFFFRKDKIADLAGFLEILFSKKSYPFNRSLSWGIRG
ncbi:MAG: hypothetical protein PHS17_07890 [Desulfobacterales bacterium]|nr:hypothetical protein [Desulfobacterales bacterium]